LDKIENNKVSLHEQEYLLILEKERNLALDRRLAKKAAKVEKLTTDLSLANDTSKRMSKDCTLTNESLAFLKATHSELQTSFSCLTDKHKNLEANYSVLWESTKANPKAKLDSNKSTSKCCSICPNVDINALKNNLARLVKTIKRKDKEIAQLNMLINQGKIGAKSTPKVIDKQRLGHYKDNKVDGRVVVKGHEIPLLNKGGYLNTFMDIADGVTTSTTTKADPNVVNTTKVNRGVNSASKASKNVVELKPHYNKIVD
jgi:hypothetical protein